MNGRPRPLAQALPVQIAGQVGLVGTAALGGWIFALLGVPGGWLSGGMIAVALQCAAGWAAPVSVTLRRLAMLTSGVAIGAGLTPSMLKGLSSYPASLALMLVGVACITALSARMLVQVPGFTRLTAFFASVPGALSFVFSVAATTNADLSRVAVVQLVRIFVLMAVLPLIVVESGVPVAPPSVLAIDPLVLIAGMFLGGAALGAMLERLNVAAAMLFGAMIVSGTLHASGMAPGRLPLEITAAGQVLIGAFVGGRFVGFDWALFARTALASVTSLALSILLSALFAGLASLLLIIPFSETLIAFAPGGLEAMTILAFALGLDPLYVGAHHLARFIAISLALPLVIRFWVERE